MLCVEETREVYLLTNMPIPPTSGNAVDEEGNASKPLCSESYNNSIGFVDLSDMVANSLYFIYIVLPTDIF